MESDRPGMWIPGNDWVNDWRVGNLERKVIKSEAEMTYTQFVSHSKQSESNAHNQ